MREGKRARRIWFSIWRDAWKEGDKISERRGSRHREKKVKGKTRMFFCLSHLQQGTLQPQSVACLQSGFCSEHTSRCVQKLSAFAFPVHRPRGRCQLFLAHPPSLSCPIHSLYSALQLLAQRLERGLLLQVTDSGHSSQRRMVLLGCQYHQVHSGKQTIGFDELSLGILGDIQLMLNFRKCAIQLMKFGWA